MNTQIATVSSSYVLSAIEGGLKVTEIIVTEHPSIKEIITPGIMGVSRAVFAWSKKPSEYAKGQVVKVSNPEELKTWLVGKPEIKSLLVDPKRKVTGWSFLLIQRGKSVVRVALVDGSRFVEAATSYMVANPQTKEAPKVQVKETPKAQTKEQVERPDFESMTVQDMKYWLKDNHFNGVTPKLKADFLEVCSEFWDEEVQFGPFEVEEFESAEDMIAAIKAEQGK